MSSDLAQMQEEYIEALEDTNRERLQHILKQADEIKRLNDKLEEMKKEDNNLRWFIMNVMQSLALHIVLHGTHRERNVELTSIIKSIRDRLSKVADIDEIPF